MNESSAGISRRSFVAAAGASAIGAGLAGSLIGCSSGTSETKEGSSDTFSVFSAYDRDAGRWIPTSCNMCFCNCGIEVHVVDGVAVEIRGNKNSSVGSGTICPKGCSGLMQLYDPARITKPMKRTNPNKSIDEDPGWEEISWDEAYDLMAEHIGKAVEEDPINGFAWFGMIASLHGLHSLFDTIGPATGGTPTWIPADTCGQGIHTVTDLYTGDGNAGPDWRYCKYMLGFGTQAGIATRHGFNISTKQWAERRDEGARMVLFDPHLSAGPEKADLWVPIRPGTDAAAAIAIANVMVNELEQYDIDFLKERTNAPALVDLETQRILRSADGDKALFMDSDNEAKPYDEAKDPVLEGEFTVDGKKCKTAFSLYREHIAKYTPEYQEPITTVPAATIRQVAKEFVEAACIGETITIDGYEMRYRPVCADMFSGVTRHKQSAHNCNAIIQLNMLVGALNTPGGCIGFASRCKGWTDTNDQAKYDVGIWEPDGLIEANTFAMAQHSSVYANVYSDDYTPTSPGFCGKFLCLSTDPHLWYLNQHHPERFNNYFNRTKVCLSYACNPLNWWMNRATQEKILLSLDYLIGVDIYLNDSSYYYDLILPEANYLERDEALTHHFFNHREPCSLDVDWSATFTQKVLEPTGGQVGVLQMMGEVAKRLGHTKDYALALQRVFRIKDEYMGTLTEEFDYEKFMDAVFKSVVDEDHGLEWFRENGVYTHPRDVDEAYIWADGRAGRVPLYWDFILESKERVTAKAAELGFEWPTDNFLPFPEWIPGGEYEIPEEGFDMIPIYWTDHCNTDTWQFQNAYLNEINELNEYAYTIEISSASAKEKGLSNGDTVRLSNTDGVEVEGKLYVSETLHPECVCTLMGSMDSKSAYLPIARGKGIGLNDLYPGDDQDKYCFMTGAYDQAVRVKIEKIA